MKQALLLFAHGARDPRWAAPFEEVARRVAAQSPGETRNIVMHDGGVLRVKRLDAEYDPSDKVRAMAYLESHRAKGIVVTGLLYVAENASDLHDAQQTVDQSVWLALLAPKNVDPGLVRAASPAEMDASHLAGKLNAPRDSRLQVAPTGARVAAFGAVVAELDAAGIRLPIVHAANSAALLTRPAAHFTMVRLGIALYGLAPSSAVPLPAGFRPALRWKTQVAQVKVLPAGSPVSYGNTYRTERETTLAVVPVGYAAGFRRAPFHWGDGLLRGRRAPNIGRVPLDQTTLDLLHGLPETVTVTAYFTGDLPPELSVVRQDFKDLLVEYAERSGGKLVFEFEDPGSSEAVTAKAVELGVRPLLAQTRAKDRSENIQVLMGAVVRMATRKAVIPALQKGPGMEWILSSAIAQAATVEKPLIGVMQGHQEPSLQALDELAVQLNAQYDVEATAIYDSYPVSYTHLRAHETVLDLVCRLLLDKKNDHITHVKQLHLRNLT